MPTYEYACKACGHEWEEIQKISDPPIKVCEKCGAPQAQRLISKGNFILKGSGWYATGGYGTTTKPSGDDGGGGGVAKKAESTSGDSASKPSSPATSPAGGSGSGGSGGGDGGGASGGGSEKSKGSRAA